jgi:hypothetical protein
MPEWPHYQTRKSKQDDRGWYGNTGTTTSEDETTRCFSPSRFGNDKLSKHEVEISPAVVVKVIKDVAVSRQNGEGV